MSSQNPLNGARYSPFGDPRTQMVDSLIGSAYQVVEYVSRHINEIAHTSMHMENIFNVSQHLEGIDFLAQNLEPIKEVNNNIVELKHIYEELDKLVLLSDNVPAIYAINANMDNINNLYAHIDAVEEVAPAIPAIIRVNANIDNILRAETNSKASETAAKGHADRAKISEDNARTSASAAATSAQAAKQSAESIDSPVLYRPMSLNDAQKEQARANIEAFRIPYGAGDQYIDGTGVPKTLNAWAVGLENVANKNEWELATTGPIAQVINDRLKRIGDSNIGFMESAMDVMGNTGDYANGRVTPGKTVSNFKIIGNNKDFTLVAPAAGQYSMAIYVWPSSTPGNMAATGFDFVHGTFDKGNLNILTILSIGSNKWLYITKGS